MKMMSELQPEGQHTEDRWFQMAESTAQDAYTAGADAAAGALGDRTDARLMVVFCSDSYDHGELLRGINERSGGVALIGCSTAGEIATSGAHDAGVVVSAIGGEGFVVQTAAATSASKRLREAGAEVAGCLEAVATHPQRLLLLLTDGLAGDQQEIVRGAYGVLGAGVPLVGGCAGDDLKMKATYQFHGDEVLTDSVVGAAVSTNSTFGIGVCHGWKKVGEPMLVTKSSNNRVYEIDDEPALNVYLRMLGAPEEVHSDPAAFTRYALTHPLGLDRPSGERQVRFVGEADFEDRSLGCIAEVPQGGLVWFMEGDDASVLQATNTACEDALANLGGRRPLGVLAFDCIARRGVLGDEGVRDEVARIADVTKAPVAGFYTYGEIARTRGVAGFHNQTLVVLALS